MNKEVRIKCPECGRGVALATPFVVDYFDPSFNCKCGAKGELSWIRGGVVVLTKKKKEKKG